MARRKHQRIYGTSGHPMFEALPLGVAFVVGVVGSIAFKLLPGLSMWGAVFAAGVLVSYAIYAFVATQLRLDAETIGDNCYYLGFLFTLSSLAVTLALVVSGDTNTYEDRIPSIISGFGIALSSTIVGVFLRVFMMQFKVDMESRERQERHHLNEASRRFRTELGQSLESIKSFSVESVQQNVEREKQLREAFDQLMADMQDELLKSAAEFGPALRESVRQQTEASLQMVSEAVNESSVTAAAGIRKALKEMSDIATDLAKHNSDASERIQQSVQLLVDSTVTLTRGSEETIKMLAQTQVIASDMTAAFTREIKEGADGMAQEMRAARKRLETGTSGFADATIKAGVAFEERAERIGQSLEVAADRTSKAFDDAAVSIGSKFDGAAAQIGQASERLAERIDQVLPQATAEPASGVFAPQDNDTPTREL